MDTQTLIILFDTVLLVAEVAVIFLLIAHFRKLDVYTKVLERHIQKLDSRISELERQTKRVETCISRLDAFRPSSKKKK